MKSQPHGKPDITIAGLKIWANAHGSQAQRESIGASQLHVTARCTNEGASQIDATGLMLELRALNEFLGACEAMNETLKGVARLATADRQLSAELSMRVRGRVGVTVRVRPTQHSDECVFVFDIDQSYLPAIIRSCRRIAVHTAQSADAQDAV